MRSTIFIAAMLLTTGAVVVVTPTALACDVVQRDVPAGDATVILYLRQCEYASGGSYSTSNTTAVAVQDNARALGVGLVVEDYSGGYSSGGNGYSYDLYRVDVGAGMGRIQLVSASATLSDSNSQYNQDCNSSTGAGANWRAPVAGSGGVAQYVPGGGGSPLPCRWNDALLP